MDTKSGVEIVNPAEVFAPWRVRDLMAVLSEVGDLFTKRGGDEVALYEIVVELARPDLARGVYDAVRKGTAPEKAFWTHLHGEMKGRSLIGRKGSEWTMERLAQLSERVEDALAELRHSMLPSLRGAVFDFNEDAWSVLSPVRLMRIIAEGVPGEDGHVDELARSHASFKLALMIKFLLIDVADPGVLRGMTLEIVQEIRRQHLFEPGESSKISLVCERDSKTGRVKGVTSCGNGPPPCVKVFTSGAEANKCYENYRDHGKEAMVKDFDCRSILSGDGALRYWVATNRRPKRNSAFLVKESRKLLELNMTSEGLARELMKDNRGGRYTLVAIEELATGALRVPSRKDLNALREIVVAKVWSQETMHVLQQESNGDNHGHHSRSHAYYDIKLLGWVATPHRRKTHMGFYEEIFLTAWDLVSVTWSFEEDNHEIRRAIQILEFLADSLPPDRRAHFGTMEDEREELVQWYRQALKNG